MNRVSTELPTGAAQLCLCGSSKAFADCCEPLLKGQRQALSAEQLMRSRYSAFSCGNTDYLQLSQHPSTRQVITSAELAHDQWLQLTIIKTQQGTAADDSGTVEFIASYSPTPDNGEDPSGRVLQQLHEVSNFVREQGRWLYLDGQNVSNQTAAQLRWNRNTPCWCGSGKKFKKCHG